MRNTPNEQMQRFNFLSREIDSAYSNAARKLGLTDSAFHILYTLADSGGECGISDICGCGISKQTINSALRRLECEGIIYLENSDGKRKNVCLTEKGRMLSENTVMKIISIENEIFSSWKKSETALYVGLTERYLGMFREFAGREL